MKKSLLAGPTTDTDLLFNPVYDIVSTEDGGFITLQSQGQLRFWDQSRSATLGDIQSHLIEIRCGAYSPRQRLLAVGSAMGKLEVWDLDRPERPMTSVVDLDEVSSCQFTPDGSLLISADEQGRISFWEPRTLQRLQVVHGSSEGEAIRCLVVSNDGQRLLAGTRLGRVQVWDLAERKLLHTIRVTRTATCPDDCIETVALLPGNREFVAATHAGEISLWNVNTGANVRRIAESAVGIRSGVLSANGRFFVSGSAQGHLSVWDITTGDCLKSMKQSSSTVRSVACDDRGRTVICGDWAGNVNWHCLEGRD